MSTWIARVEWTTAEPHAGPLADDLALEHVIAGRHTYSATLTLEADTLQDAIAAATDHPAAAGQNVDGIQIQILRREAHEHRTRLPRLPDLVDYGDIGDMLGMTRQSARELAAIPGFPEPVVTTQSGPLRTRAAVEAWHRNWAGPSNPVDALDHQHVDELLRTCLSAGRDDLARAAALVALAGIALKEALRATWADVAEDLNEIRIRPPKGHEHHRTRVASIPETTRTRLAEILGPRQEPDVNVVTGTDCQLEYRRASGPLQKTLRSIFGTAYGAQDLHDYFAAHHATSR